MNNLMNRRSAVLGVLGIAVAAGFAGGESTVAKPEETGRTEVNDHDRTLRIIAEAVNDLPDDVRFFLMEETTFYLDIIRLPLTLFEDGSVILHSDK